jgi:hypothetical protein
VITSMLTALATVAVAIALLVSGGHQAPRAKVAPRAGHAPTHYEFTFASLSPARDVWGQDERTR